MDWICTIIEHQIYPSVILYVWCYDTTFKKILLFMPSTTFLLKFCWYEGFYIVNNTVIVTTEEMTKSSF